ncbi:altered inheritance of mitochondria protein 44-like [Lotus japonicus]|uniref:altered inheritance of mitochondria protein 44-like n=1 Tax=Lotus japonicus TaxID=34305 RepID=UPI00258EF2A0|nr:altered inheritance of mitochondria protein 44-like [Lotus japonicus]
MTRLSDDDILRFRREQQAAREKRNPAKTLLDADASHSGTESNRPQKKKRKNETPESAKGKDSSQPSMEKFMVKGNPQHMTHKAGSSSAPPPSWKSLLKEFEELTSEEVTSLWDSKIDFNSLVETNLVFEADREKVKKIGLKEACQAIMTKGLEIVAISKMIDLETADFDGINSAKQLEEKEREILKMKATMKLLDSANKVNEKKAADLALENERLKKHAEDLNITQKAKEEELVKSKAEITHLNSSNAELKNENSKLHSEVSELKNSVLDQFEAGFAKAKEQILFLNPQVSINFAGSDPYARIVDGKLISPDTGDEEDEGEEDKNEEDENVNDKEDEGENH